MKAAKRKKTSVKGKAVSEVRTGTQDYVLTVKTTTETTLTKVEPRVPVAQWGADHWSTFAYIETRCVDHDGVPNIPHMRCDGDRHPQFDHMGARGFTGKKYPTRIKDGELPDHDDWDCLEDMELVGLLENIGTGVNPVYKLKALGRMVAAQLRQHKMDKGTFSTFTPTL